MPHPTPVQIAYGSATVISTTLVLLLLAPTGSGLALTLIAAFALLCGGVVALAVRSRRAARRSPEPEPRRSFSSPERPEVRV